MAKNKQQKQKERERRVAKKKLAEAARRRAQEKTTPELKTGVPERTKIMTAAVPRTESAPADKNRPFTMRRNDD